MLFGRSGQVKPGVEEIGVVRVGAQLGLGAGCVAPACHPPSLGSPIPDGGLSAPAPCPAELLCQPSHQQRRPNW